MVQIKRDQALNIILYFLEGRIYLSYYLNSRSNRIDKINFPA